MKLHRYLAFLPMLLVSISGASDLYWYYYPVDTAGHLAGNTKIAYDSKGNLKVAYRSLNRSVRYAEFDGKAWTHQQSADSCFIYFDFALDKDDQPHFVYYQEGQNVIHVGRQNGKWVKSVIAPNDTGENLFYLPGIVVDSKNTSHMIFTRGITTRWPALGYASRDADGNASKPIDLCASNNGGLCAKWKNIVLDAEDRPVIGYSNSNGVAVRYMVGSEWKNQWVDSVGEDLESHWAYIARGKDSAFWMASQNIIKRKLYYATGKVGGEWKIGVVDTMPGNTTNSTMNPIAADHDGNPYIAYVRAKADGYLTIDSSMLLLAHYENGEWKSQVVDTTGISGEYASIAVGPSGLPAISYMERNHGQLMVAIASLTAPPDTNNNGIPDYKEVPNSIRRVLARRQGALAAPAPAYDAAGRVVGRHPRAVRKFQGTSRSRSAN